jgi:hypothetical protein
MRRFVPFDSPTAFSRIMEMRYPMWDSLIAPVCRLSGDHQVCRRPGGHMCRKPAVESGNAALQRARVRVERPAVRHRHVPRPDHHHHGRRRSHHGLHRHR